jgi:hypothetical protein
MDKLIKTMFAIGFYCVLYTQASYAYIDPGTGSMYLQLIASIFLGLLFTVKMYWSKVKTLPKKLFHNHKNDGKET